MHPNVKIFQLKKTDADLFFELVLLFRAVFATEGPVPEYSYCETILNSDNFTAVVCTYEGKIVGGITAHEIKTYTSPGTEWFIYDLGVHVDFRRRGYARNLLAFIRKLAYQKNIEILYLLAENEDEEAIRFYQSTGATPSDVNYFTFEPLEN